MTNDDLDPDLRRALSGLSRDVSPPPELEDRVVESLRGSGAIRARRRGAWTWVGRAVAAGLLVTAGVLAGRWSALPSTPTGERFLLLLVGDPSLGDPEKEQRFYDEYAAWGGRLAQGGHMVSAARLDDARPSLVEADGKLALTSEKPGAGVSGFFMIRAHDEQEAIALARESPHLKYGGRIEIRRLVGRP